jgi:hypothetical protein
MANQILYVDLHVACVNLDWLDVGRNYSTGTAYVQAVPVGHTIRAPRKVPRTACV